MGILTKQAFHRKNYFSTKYEKANDNLFDKTEPVNDKQHICLYFVSEHLISDMNLIPTFIRLKPCRRDMSFDVKII